MTDKSWKPCTNEKINKMYKKILAALGDNYFRDSRGDVCNAPVIYEFTSIRVGGQAYKGRIAINSYLADNEEALATTIVHELGHIDAGNLNHHNIIWEMATCKIARIVSRSLGIHIECSTYMPDDISCLLMAHKKLKVPKYEIYCPTCNKSLKKYVTLCDTIKHPEQWRHSTCNTICKSRKIEEVTK